MNNTTSWIVIRSVQLLPQPDMVLGNIGAGIMGFDWLM